jgi:hypothetical protein
MGERKVLQKDMKKSRKSSSFYGLFPERKKDNP